MSYHSCIFYCPQCKRHFVEIGGQKQGIASVNNESLSLFVCEDCGSKDEIIAGVGYSTYSLRGTINPKEIE